MIEDTPKYKRLREKLVETIRKKGISDKNVLDAILLVPRHFFVDTNYLNSAYDDNPLPIGYGQTISQPYTVAFQTSLLQIKKGDKVLEIGTGSGYQACILAQLGAEVYTIERIKQLYEKTTNFLKLLGYNNVTIFYGDGSEGLPAFAPYDKILVTAAAPQVPNSLLQQLKISGRLVIPIDVEYGLQEMLTIDRTSENEYITQKHGYFRFVPLLKDVE